MVASCYGIITSTNEAMFLLFSVRLLPRQFNRLSTNFDDFFSDGWDFDDFVA